MEDSDETRPLEPRVNIKLENDDHGQEESYVQSHVDLDRFIKDAKALDPDLLTATIGPIVYPKAALWDVLVQKMNVAESSEVGKVYDCIQMVISEMRHLLTEVHGLLSSCVKKSDALELVLKCCDQMTQCLASEFYLEPKAVHDIPKFFFGLMCEVKVEDDKSFNDHVDLDEDDAFDEILDQDYDEDEPLMRKKPRKQNNPCFKRKKSCDNSNSTGSKKLRRRPNVKDTPPDMKLPADIEEKVCDSRRRRYCQVCTKGFGNQKRLDSHMSNGDCPGKPNPKWHYTNMGTKRLFCIHPDCLPPSGVFDINYLENSFNSGCIARGYYDHVMEKHATTDNCVGFLYDSTFYVSDDGSFCF